MEATIIKCNAKEYEMREKGTALITALLISATILIIATGVLYFINQSITMSGAGRRYTTAEEAADGAIEAVKDTINLVNWTEPIPGGLFTTVNCDEVYIPAEDNLTFAIQNLTTPCTTTIALPGTIGNYTATITVERLYTKELPGGRLEFARSAGGPPATAIFYRITTIVTGPDNTMAENAVLYRYTG